MAQKIWTTAEIRHKLETDQRWLERAVLALYERQTAQEQRVGGTLERNHVGFDGSTGHYLSYIARWLKSGRPLSGRHLEKTRRKMVHFAGQLARIANGEGSPPKTGHPAPRPQVGSGDSARSDREWKTRFAECERRQEQEAFRSDPDLCWMAREMKKGG